MSKKTKMQNHNELWVDITPEMQEIYGAFTPAHPGDAGIDLRSVGPVTLQPGQTCSIATGVSIKLPTKTEGQVRTKSGLALKKGLVVLNSPGTIDEGYRGQIMVLVHNTSRQIQHIASGDKIAQLVIAKYERPPVHFRSVTEVISSRGADGFGSTGN